MARRPYVVGAVPVTRGWRWAITAPNGVRVVTSDNKFETKFAAERAAEAITKLPLVFTPRPRENGK